MIIYKGLCIDRIEEKEAESKIEEVDIETTIETETKVFIF